MHVRVSGFLNWITTIGLHASDVTVFRNISWHSWGEILISAKGCVADVLRRLYHTQVRAREARQAKSVCAWMCVCITEGKRSANWCLFLCRSDTCVRSREGFENGSIQIILAEQPSEVKHGVLPVRRGKGTETNKSRNWKATSEG